MKIGVTQMTALLVAVLLVGCAPRLTRGESSGLKWHVTELTTSERPATYIGYKSDGRVKVYRYVVVLEENSGVGVNFGQVETTILARPGTGLGRRRGRRA